MLQIEKYDHQGRGIAHADNKIYFIENAMPNELVLIKTLKEKNNIVESVVIKLENPNQDRVQPLCPYYNECGGCNIMHMNRERQLVFKLNKVKEILAKYAALEPDLVNEIIAGEQFNYRNKVTLQVNEHIGYYERGSKKIVPIGECLIANETINEVINKLSKELSYKGIKEIIIRAFDKDDVSLTFNLQNERSLTEFTTLFASQAYKVSKCSSKTDYKIGDESNIIGKLGEYEFLVGPEAFFQVNSEQAERMYYKIASYLGDMPKQTVIDLYCGVGSIGIFIANMANYVIGVEVNEQAVRNARENAKKNNVDNIKFIKADLALEELELDYRIDVVIVDPPRAGLSPILINKLMSLKVPTIIYVSCEPMTLARDIKILKEEYEVKEITPFDMFPNTYHVECVGLLTLKEMKK